MPDVPVPLLLLSDGVHFMNEMVAGSPFNLLDHAHNVFVVDGRVNLPTNSQHQAVNFLLP